MTYIEQITAREILDSRGRPTVEGEVLLSDGSRGVASVPSGASTGSFEARELRDNEANRYDGQGVRLAVANIKGPLRDILIGEDPRNQEKLDRSMIELDGTPNKERYGANAILAISLALAKASAASCHEPLFTYLRRLAGNTEPLSLPVPQMNILNGGAHADNSIDFQEFMIVPVGSDTFAESLRTGAEIFSCLRELLKEAGLSTAVGDEGGFAPSIARNEEAVKYLSAALASSHHGSSGTVMFALDVASTEFFDGQKYQLYDNNRLLSSTDMADLLETLTELYPIISIEDGMAESDWDGWAHLTQQLGDKVQLTGDDLFVTNVAILNRGISSGIANSILIKPNQIGTLTETFETVKAAKESGYAITISHRSGETEDTTIADLAVALGPCQIKTGSLTRSERVAKYNRLLRIEEYLDSAARYAGVSAFPQLDLERFS
ncbi:MAG: phosphopyruvate hydratase [Acidiferrobacteraceae bacterium]|nr:phosphopyruvate hydratase [Acidiferrobacteraceae bacterium]